MCSWKFFTCWPRRFCSDGCAAIRMAAAVAWSSNNFALPYIMYCSAWVKVMRSTSKQLGCHWENGVLS